MTRWRKRLRVSRVQASARLVSTDTVMTGALISSRTGRSGKVASLWAAAHRMLRSVMMPTGRPASSTTRQEMPR